MTLSPDELASFVAASCVRHGVPVKVTDMAALAVVATLLQGRDSRPTAPAVGGCPARSEPPHQINSARIEHGAALGWCDYGTVHDGSHDRVLPRQAQLGPRR